MEIATGSLGDASLSMTVDRAGSFDRPIGLATDLAVLFFGLVGAGLFEEPAMGFGPLAVVFLFFSATKVSNDTGRAERLNTYSGKALQGRASSIQGPSS